jgi:hypothetical protein
MQSGMLNLILGLLRNALLTGRFAKAYLGKAKLWGYL